MGQRVVSGNIERIGVEVMAIKQNDYPLEELVPVVAELASGYTGYEHSSITYEKAQMLMEGVLYCINEYEHFSKNTSISITYALSNSLRNCCSRETHFT